MGGRRVRGEPDRGLYLGAKAFDFRRSDLQIDDGFLVRAALAAQAEQAGVDTPDPRAPLQDEDAELLAGRDGTSIDLDDRLAAEERDGQDAGDGHDADEAEAAAEKQRHLFVVRLQGAVEGGEEDQAQPERGDQGGAAESQGARPTRAEPVRQAAHASSVPPSAAL